MHFAIHSGLENISIRIFERQLNSITDKFLFPCWCFIWSLGLLKKQKQSSHLRYSRTPLLRLSSHNTLPKITCHWIIMLNNINRKDNKIEEYTTLLQQNLSKRMLPFVITTILDIFVCQRQIGNWNSFLKTLKLCKPLYLL